ncbi:MAG: hypothetical protein HKO58_06690 [Gammaproteobacteria bacterium]|nr:hypothetical protein [Gammaproteobacteria bacterium]
MTENNDRQRYLAVLKKAIAPGGHVVLATFAPDGPSRCSGLDIVQYDGVKISSLLGNEFALLQQCMETHHTPAGNCQQFAYFHFKRQSQEN